jgi:putative holliday junction resolvase
VALDLGEVRTGVAVSDPGGVIASPLEVVQSGDLPSYLRRLVDERDVREIVVGVPRTLGGEVGFQARRIVATLDALRRDFPDVRFVEWDERLTTRIAAKGSRRGKKKPVRLDHLAAARMLQEYLEARRNA